MFGKQEVKKSIVERSADVLSVFRKASKELVDINEEAHLTIDMNNEMISRLAEDNDNLTLLAENNDKIIENLKMFIGTNGE